MEQARQAYLSLLNELSGRLDQLSELARQKTQAVKKDDLTALDEALKQEQAMTLNLRGLEQKRLRAVSQLGLEGSSLSELASRYPDSMQIQARQTAEKLLRSYQEYRCATEVARNTLELNLHEIEKVIAASGVDTAGVPGYAAPVPEPPKRMKTDFRA